MNEESFRVDGHGVVAIDQADPIVVTAKLAGAVISAALSRLPVRSDYVLIWYN